MLNTPHILLPGPTPIPEKVQQAMTTSMSDHRGAIFEPVMHRVRQRLHELFHLDPQGQVAVLPAAGTGGLEACIQNFFEPGDRVLSVETGMFGKRFAEIARAMGLEVISLTVPWGQAFSVEAVLEELDRNAVRGILTTHNETSTGVLNPIRELGLALQKLPNRPLYIVDSISGVPSIELPMAAWGVDVVIAASQKGFMCPPGLAIFGIRGDALDALQPHRLGRHYFNLLPYVQGQLPYTPAVSLWYGLDAALDLLAEEGEAARFARHRLLAQMARAFGEAAGLEPIVNAACASWTVTALNVPPPLSPGQLRRQCQALGLQIAGGMGPWHDRAVRLGHVGAVDAADLWAGLGILAHFVPHPEAGLAKAFSVWHATA